MPSLPADRDGTLSPVARKRRQVERMANEHIAFHLGRNDEAPNKALAADLLVADYVDEFICLLSSKHTRLVWGAMTALAAIAPIVPDRLAPHVDAVRAAMARGSVIAVDRGVSVLATLASSSPERSAELVPVLLEHLATCRAKEVPQHSERSLIAVSPGNADTFIDVLERRLPELTRPQAERVRKVVAVATNRTT
jgi:hypothetical protein